MRKLFALCALLGAFCAARGQITLAGHTVVPSPSDSLLGQSSVVIGDADCNLTSPSGCTVPSGTGPYRGTLLVTSSASLTADRNLIAPLSPGRAYYVKNSTTGSHQVCVKGSIGNAACVPNGQTAIALSDGTNYNLISGGGGGGSTSALGLVVADGVTYATIQAAYTAACGAVPNLNVYVPANSTVTDTLSTTVNYLISTCTSQITDGRLGRTLGSARANALFQPRYERIEYHPKQAEMKQNWIEMARNGANLINLGIPAVPQQVYLNPGNSIGGFAKELTILQRGFGLGLVGVLENAAHVGGGNNSQLYGLQADALSITSVAAGTTSIATNGTPDPTSPNGASITLGSSSATGSIDVYMMSSNMGTNETFRIMPQFKFFYLCDGHGAFSATYTPDGVTYFPEPVTWNQPNTCATTGSIKNVGVVGNGSGTCTADITLGATGGGGSGFTGIGHINSTGGVSWVEVTAGGSGYDPYSTTITQTGGGTCSVAPIWSNIRTSNMSIQVATFQHDGLGRVHIVNQAGSSVKLFAWMEYDPNTPGIVYEDMGFGGSSISDDFTADSSYSNGFWQNIPAPDSVLIAYFNPAQVAGHNFGYWITQWNTRAVALQANKVSGVSTQTACNALGNWWNLTSSVCNAYTPDLEYISGYTAGFNTDPSAQRDIDADAMASIEAINRAGGNANYVDINYPSSSGQDLANRGAFSSTDPTHVIGAGQVWLNYQLQKANGIPDQRIFENRALSTIRLGQGSFTAPALNFIHTAGTGLYVDSSNRNLMSSSGIGANGIVFSQSPTLGALNFTPFPASGGTSATYAICALNNYGFNPFACTPDISIATGVNTLSSTSYNQFCLANEIPGATQLVLLRRSGYTGALVVQQTTLFSNATTPKCMYDIGQTGNAYSLANLRPTGGISINNPANLTDAGRVFSARIFDSSTGYSDVFLETGSAGGNVHGAMLKTLDNGSFSNACQFTMGNSTSTGFEAYCAGTFANAPFSMRQPMVLNPNAATNSTLRITSASSLYTGTTKSGFELRSNSVNECPTNGCGLHINMDGSYGGYIAQFRQNNNSVIGLKNAAIEFFGNTTNPITGLQGSTGANLFRCAAGTFTAGHFITVDASGNCTDGGSTPTSGTVTNFSTGTWPLWLSPSTATSTTTPVLSVSASPIPNSALANSSTTVNGVSCTLGSSCSISTGSGTVNSGTSGNLASYPSTGTTIGDSGIAASNVIVGNKGSVTFTAQSAAGTTGTAACVSGASCNANRGRVQVTPGGTGIGTGPMFTINFGTAYPNTQYTCQVTQNGFTDGVQANPQWAPTSTTVVTVSTSGSGTLDAFIQEFDYACWQ